MRGMGRSVKCYFWRKKLKSSNYELADLEKYKRKCSNINFWHAPLKEIPLPNVQAEAEKVQAVQKKNEAEIALALARKEAAQQEAQLQEQQAAQQAARMQVEAAQQEVAQQEAAQREAAQREAVQREAAQREAAQREAAQREAAQREAAQRESLRQIAQTEAARQEAARQMAEAARLEAVRAEETARLTQTRLDEEKANALRIAEEERSKSEQFENARLQAMENARLLETEHGVSVESEPEQENEPEDEPDVFTDLDAFRPIQEPKLNAPVGEEELGDLIPVERKSPLNLNPKRPTIRKPTGTPSHGDRFFNPTSSHIPGTIRAAPKSGQQSSRRRTSNNFPFTSSNIRPSPRRGTPQPEVPPDVPSTPQPQQPRPRGTTPRGTTPTPPQQPRGTTPRPRGTTPRGTTPAGPPPRGTTPTGPPPTRPTPRPRTRNTSGPRPQPQTPPAEPPPQRPKSYAQRARDYFNRKSNKNSNKTENESKKNSYKTEDESEPVYESPLTLEKRKEYLDLLGLDESATPDQIRKRYFRLSIQLHPDKNPGRDTTEQFQNLKHAYNKLYINGGRRTRKFK